jgi:hypothetical protein
MSPSRGSTPRQTNWLTISRNVTWTWTCWHKSCLRYQQGNTTLLTSQTSSARDRQHLHHAPVAAAHSTRASMLGQTKRKPASRYIARSSRCAARRSAGQQESQLTATPTALLRASSSTASQLTRGKLHPACSRHARLPSANRYAPRPFSGPTNSATNWLRHNCPFQGQQTLQQASWHYENFAQLPWSSVTLIVNICYSGCLRTRVRHPTIPIIIWWIRHC